MATLEDRVTLLTEEFEKLQQKNEDIEGELIWCQGELARQQKEIVSLKKSKLDMSKQLKERNTNVKDLTDLVGASRTRDCTGRSSALEKKVDKLCGMLTEGLQKVDETDTRVDRLHRVFNRVFLALEEAKLTREERHSEPGGNPSSHPISSSLVQASASSPGASAVSPGATAALIGDQQDVAASTITNQSKPFSSNVDRQQLMTGASAVSPGAAAALIGDQQAIAASTKTNQSKPFSWNVDRQQLMTGASAVSPGATAALIGDQPAVAASTKTNQSKPFSSNVDRQQQIKDRSKFDVVKVLQVQIPMDRNEKIDGYDFDFYNDVRSPYLDWQTGMYRVPVGGKYVFGVRAGAGMGESMEWYLCGEIGMRGRRTKLIGRRVALRKADNEWCEYNKVEWVCMEGENVWVEGMRVGEDIRSAFRFYGELSCLIEGS